MFDKGIISGTRSSRVFPDEISSLPYFYIDPRVRAHSLFGSKEFSPPDYRSKQHKPSVYSRVYNPVACTQSGSGPYGNIVYCVRTVAIFTFSPLPPLTLSNIKNVSLYTDFSRWPAAPVEFDRAGTGFLCEGNNEGLIPLYLKNNGGENFYQCEIIICFRNCTRIHYLEYKYKIELLDGTILWQADSRYQKTYPPHGNSRCFPFPNWEAKHRNQDPPGSAAHLFDYEKALRYQCKVVNLLF
jgi:hypothetical protein